MPIVLCVCIGLRIPQNWDAFFCTLPPSGKEGRAARNTRNRNEENYFKWWLEKFKAAVKKHSEANLQFAVSKSLKTDTTYLGEIKNRNVFSSQNVLVLN